MLVPQVLMGRICSRKENATLFSALYNRSSNFHLSNYLSFNSPSLQNLNYNPNRAVSVCTRWKSSKHRVFAVKALLPSDSRAVTSACRGFQPSLLNPISAHILKAHPMKTSHSSRASSIFSKASSRCCENHHRPEQAPHLPWPLPWALRPRL